MNERSDTAREATDGVAANARRTCSDGVCIRLKDVRFAYGDDADATEALRGISLDIRTGEHVCILGGNGSGKSTLIQLMSALLLPSSGTVEVLGIDAAAPGGAQAIRRRAAMVFQSPEDQMVTSIVADDVAFGAENLGVPQAEIVRRVDAALEAVGMLPFAQADPADLSGGQRQRVAIAGALAMEPDILLLDEPSAMLDTQGRRAIQGIIRHLNERGITIVHVTHFMDDALLADRVIVLERGHIALDGTPDEVFARRETVRALGLELPFAMQLAERLGDRGLDVPMTPDPDELARAVAERIRVGRAEARGPEAEKSVVRETPEKDASGGHLFLKAEKGISSDDHTSSPVGNLPHDASPARAAAQRSIASALSNDTAEVACTGVPSRTGGAESPLDDDPSRRSPAVAFKGTSFSYANPGTDRPKRSFFHRAKSPAAHSVPLALDDLSLDIAPGVLCALVGHTGSGKSTVAELACALKFPTAGTVEISGIDTRDLSRRRELRRQVGYVSQYPERQLFAETVYEDIAFGCRNLGLEESEIERRVTGALAAVNLPADRAFRDRSPFELSGGQQRGVAIAGILAMRTTLLVLDEPMAGLDPAGRAAMRSLIRSLKANGTTLLLITHAMDDVAELADTVAVLDRGHLIAADAPGRIFARADITDVDAGGLGLGVPHARAFAERLCSVGAPIAITPLTLDALVEEVVRGAAA